MILDTFRLDGRTAVVTGASRGIGQAIALALAEAGADIAAVSRTENRELAARVAELGRRYCFHSADLSQRDETRQVMPAVLRSLGDVDILVNNAGVIRRCAATEYSDADWDATLEIDLTAAFLLSQAAAQVMLRKGRGKIINIGSVLSLQGGIHVVAYTAAKHGVAGLTKALANEWARHGINVNALAPSYVATELTEALQADPTRSEAVTRRTPARRWGQPEDIAGAAVFLASPASDFVHGTVVLVDGGWMAW
jgi:2-dehydro-3-deoxy-D-gluconate 5-dehydrogenase